ncbi:TBC1 domain family member 5-like [Saccostrea cucullata]|uniref:TBC1 domain family member 5-like n=1 Tax=Saccostrea cuccullata TaxID=36930 RepID=UPI002ED07857
MARLETTSDRSNVSAYSPDESPLNGNVARFSTLPNMKAKGKKISKQVAEFEHRIGELQGQINEKESMSLYCANKLDKENSVHFQCEQCEILQQSFENEDEILLAIAGIKQVRDVLKGTLRFSQMEEEDMKSQDNHHETENNSSSETTQQEPRDRHRMGSNAKKGGVFYMSSEENSENAESPSEGPIPVVTPRKGSIRKEAQIAKEDKREFELSDCVPSGGRKTGAGGMKSAVDVTEKTHPLESSPNPLYNYRCSVDSV